MKIIVKPNDVIHLNQYVKKGANAFLFGITDLSIEPYTINLTVLTSVKKLIGKDVELFVSLDKNMLNSDLKLLTKTLEKLEKIGVDGIFFYDVSVLNIVREKKLNLRLILKQDFLVTNYKTINYYNDLGVEKVLVPTVVSTDEIIEMKKNTNMPLIVNVFGYQAMSYSLRKLVTNYFKHLGRLPSKNSYLITDDKGVKYPIIETKEGTIIYSSNVLNGILELERLHDVVDYVILDKNLIKYSVFVKVLEIYKDSLELDLAWLRTKKLEILKLIDNVDDGFFNKRTIFKVKRWRR